MKSVFFTDNTDLLKDANILFRSAKMYKKNGNTITVWESKLTNMSIIIKLGISMRTEKR